MVSLLLLYLATVHWAFCVLHLLLFLSPHVVYKHAEKLLSFQHGMAEPNRLDLLWPRVLLLAMLGHCLLACCPNIFPLSSAYQNRWSGSVVTIFLDCQVPKVILTIVSRWSIILRPVCFSGSFGCKYTFLFLVSVPCDQGSFPFLGTLSCLFTLLPSPAFPSCLVEHLCIFWIPLLLLARVEMAFSLTARRAVVQLLSYE